MLKSVYIAEKPSVAQEFAKALHKNMNRKDGYLECEDAIVTWCVGHLVTMSYPDAYDPALKRWSLDTLPFLPTEWKYEVIGSVSKQFHIVKQLLNREDVDRIYICTDSGREGEYIYRLVDQMAEVPDSKDKRRVWIDSQTEEEILRGIKEAKPMAEYDNISASAYLRAKEDYLMGINFSRLLTLKYGYALKDYLKQDKNVVIAVGRVMTCVFGMIVNREREIRSFVKTPFYRVLADVDFKEQHFEAEWRAVEGSTYFGTPLLYGDKGNGFIKRETAKQLVTALSEKQPIKSHVVKIEKKTEKKNPPMLFNLAELQNECAKLFKISPDETLKLVQELYEKKLVTYPRTDARVLSTAVAKEIHKNLSGLRSYQPVGAYAAYVMEKQGYKNLAKSRYVNDKQITDHYAIIPTGQGLNSLNAIGELSRKIYEVIARRFVSIFYPAAEYQKVAIETELLNEHFFASFKVLKKEGYLKVAEHAYGRKKTVKQDASEEAGSLENSFEQQAKLLDMVSELKKGSTLIFSTLSIKEGETSPPKPYTSGSLILAMENAGKLIEDEELRAQIKGSGIGTSATRAEIIKKLTSNAYISLNKKTQVVAPTQLGEMIYDVVAASIKSMLNPELTASWEKGLSMVAEGEVTAEEYIQKLNKYVGDRTAMVKQLNNRYSLRTIFDQSAEYYQKSKKAAAQKGRQKVADNNSK
ncbi:MAG: type IA DNA topoisomerase [Lachnospira sp.]|nr:type IA DNA topoisomerase [Lachnospira sp.]